MSKQNHESLGTVNHCPRCRSRQVPAKRCISPMSHLAVGVIIGAAFSKIIDSLVKQIIMPLLSVLLPGQQGYLGWKWVIDGKEVPYGLFLGEVVNFLIVSLALFLFIVKFLGWVLKVKQKEEAAPPSLTKDQELLTEIRDLLKDGRA
jgi:large conductance mechanosensitive channel